VLPELLAHKVMLVLKGILEHRVPKALKVVLVLKVA